MSSYSFPDSIEGLTKPVTDYIKGLAVHEPVIGKNLISAAMLQADLDLATKLNAENVILRAERTDVLYPAQRKADAEGRQYIGRSKKVLEIHLGADWSEQWGEAGFRDQTIQTPVSLVGRETVLKKLAAYFSTHKDQANPAVEVTSARALKLHGALSKAIAAVKANALQQKAAKSASVKAITTLRKRLRASIAELDLLLERDSEVWNALGLTPPAEKSRRRRAKQEAAKAAAAAPTPETTPARPTAPATTDGAVTLAG